MNQYANAFSCAKDNSGAEIVINFGQNTPVFNDNGDLDKVVREPVASIVMNSEHAKQFLNILSDLLKEDEQKG